MLPRGLFAEMSILDYFSRKTGTLPNPNGSLSSLMPPGAIASANREVDKLRCQLLKHTVALPPKLHSIFHHIRGNLIHMKI